MPSWPRHHSLTSLLAATSLLPLLLGSACAAPRAMTILPPASLPEPGDELNDEEAPPAFSPLVEQARPRLEERLRRARVRLGRARPALARTVLDILGPGLRRDYTLRLQSNRCYSMVVVAHDEDQELLLVLRDVHGQELARQEGGEAVVEVCPPRESEYGLTVEMEYGTGAYALGIYGS